jgi:hypothetical protein
MNYFFIGVYILFFTTTLYYITMFALSYYWHEKKTSYVVVPLIFTFKFFVAGFLVVSALAFILSYLPKILELLNY